MKVIEGLSEAERKMLVDVLENSSTGNQTTIKDIRTIDKICKIIDEAGESVELEDADHSYLLDKLRKFGGWVANAKARDIILPLAEKIGL